MGVSTVVKQRAAAAYFRAFQNARRLYPVPPFSHPYCYRPQKSRALTQKTCLQPLYLVKKRYYSSLRKPPTENSFCKLPRVPGVPLKNSLG